MLGLLKKRSIDKETLNRALEEVDFVVVDTELTGLNSRKDSIVSIGAIRMEGSRILLGDVFYRVVAPSTVNSAAVVVHEITPDETSLCPELNLVLPEFLYFIKDRVIVGHHIDLDISFINRALKSSGKKPLENPAVDTYKIYTYLKRKKIEADAFFEPAKAPESLFEIAGTYDISVQNVHHALYDAFVTAQLFQRFIHELKLRGVKTLKDLLIIGSI
ncbi:MAG: 3'-5' exonuclease [Nitrospirae bacterium]|nr:MAG: 3'-5' exonuclease [Nitrospirota bacterium]